MEDYILITYSYVFNLSRVRQAFSGHVLNFENKKNFTGCCFVSARPCFYSSLQTSKYLL